jgi:hypothetical protein
MHYLPPEHWSPRFEMTFFTAEIVARSLLSSPPIDTNFSPIDRTCGRSEKFPAIYYVIEIRNGHHRTQVFRRFSQFYWLYQQLNCVIERQNQTSSKIIDLKKNCPFTAPTDEMLDTRQDLLNDFLRDILIRPDMTLLPLVIDFLSLDNISARVNMK